MLGNIMTRAGVILLFSAFLAGCNTKTVQPSVPFAAPTKIETTRVAEAQKAKDDTVLTEAAKIDAIAPEAKPHTDAQRAAVSAAPASQVVEITTSFTRAVTALESSAVEKDKIISTLREQVTRLENAETRATAKSFRMWGVSLVLLGIALAVGAKIIPLGATVGAVGALLLAAAQIWVKVASHPWFDFIAGSLIVGALAAGASAVWHAYKKGDLTTKALREKERMEETLKVIIPALDEAKQQLGDAFKPTLAKLSSGMDWEEKQLVKKIRGLL